MKVKQICRESFCHYFSLYFVKIHPIVLKKRPLQVESHVAELDLETGLKLHSPKCTLFPGRIGAALPERGLRWFRSRPLDGYLKGTCRNDAVLEKSR